MSMPGNPNANPFRYDSREPTGTKGRTGCAIGLAIFFVSVFGILACGGVGMYIVASRGLGSVAIPPEVQPDSEKLQAEARKAFSQDTPHLSPQDAAAIETLFHAIERTSRRDDDKAFRELVDFGRLNGLMKKAVPGRQASPAQLTVHQWQLKRSISVEPDWVDCQLKDVVMLDTPGWARAYVYTSRRENSNSTFRFTIAQQDGVWKVVDWQRLDIGLSKATEWAIYAAYAEDTHLANYQRICGYMNRSDDQLEANDRMGAERELRRCDPPIVPPGLHDFVCVLVGYRWRALGNEAEALRWFQQVKEPDRAPGSWIGQAYVYQSLGNLKRAFECATNYEKAAGVDPDCSRLKVQLLKALHRDAEIEKEWRQVLRFLPKDVPAMVGIAEILPTDRLAELETLVGRTPQPTETAELLFDSLRWSNQAAAETIASLIRRREPDSARAYLVEGRLRQMNRDLDGAASLFQKAAQKTTDESYRSKCEYAYLDVLVAQGRVLEGYQNSKNAEEIFQYLAYDHEEEESLDDEQLLQLSEAHRIRAPDDVSVDYYSGLALTNLRRLADAERVLRAGLLRAKDDENRDRLRYQLAEVLYQDNRMMEGYQTIEPRTERFRQYGGSVTHEGRWKELGELIDAHRAHEPTDPWIAHYSAQMLYETGKPRESLDLLIQTMRQAGNENQTVNFMRYGMLQQSMELGELDTAYELLANQTKQANHTDALAQSAQQMIHAQKWDALSKWIELHQKRNSNDPELWKWKAELLWGTKEYDKLIAHAGDDKLTAAKSLHAYERSKLFDRYFRALLRTDRHAEAERLAIERQSEVGDSMPLILVNALAGRDEVTQGLIDKFRPPDETMDDLYDDEDIGKLLRQPSYAVWRKRRPPSLNNPASHGGTLLLLSRPNRQSVEQLRTIMASVLEGEVSMEPLAHTSSETGESFIARAGDRRIVIRRASEPHHKTQKLASEVANAPLRETCEQHKAWLAVASISDDWSDEQATLNSYHAARALVNEDCSALRFMDSARIAPNNADSLAELQRGELIDGLERIGVPFPFEADRDLTPNSRSQQNKFETEMKSFHDTFSQRRPDQTFEIVVHIDAFPVKSEIPFSVQSIQSSYGSYHIVGCLLADSPLLPAISPGEFLNVSEHQIDEWRYTDGEKSISGRRAPQQ